MKKGVNAFDWCNPLLASSGEQLYWLAKNPEARAVINDKFIHQGGGPVLTPLAFAVSYPCSLDRIRFIVEVVGAIPTECDMVISLALEKRSVMKYLHSRGARYSGIHNYFNHFIRLPNEEEKVAFVLCYPQFWSVQIPISMRISGYQSEHYRSLIATACHRKDAATDAMVAVLGLRKKMSPLLANKDVLNMIVGYMRTRQYISSAKWGKPGIGDIFRHVKKQKCCRKFGLSYIVTTVEWLFSVDEK